MAEKRRFLDIWIVETNTVYKEVPFTVVTDWIQQGRLLEGDMYKPSGTRDWLRLGGAAEFEPYFPKPEANRPDDQAEAMEPVDLDLHYTKPHEGEDEDVDMIPLIDVSLVLLVFFMLSATGAGLAATVSTPEVDATLRGENPGALRLDIDREGDGAPLYSVAVGDKAAEPDEKNLHSLASVLGRLKVHLDRSPEPVEVVINADKNLESGLVRDVLVALRRKPFRDKIRISYFGATQREP